MLQRNISRKYNPIFSRATKFMILSRCKIIYLRKINHSAIETVTHPTIPTDIYDNLWTGTSTSPGDITNKK